MQEHRHVPDCLFCKMAAGEIKPDVVYEDDEVLAFRDINPQAPVHILIIPKRHIPTLNDIAADDAALVGRLFLVARDLARQEGVDEAGYRTLFNCNRHGGQEVFHIHLHLLGGRQMHWPPG
ncbi:MAG TPA: histidine triad nucleotide-binding protein [Sedimenticola sp.]|nr:histidine triad nucleotide-binding protein [Sedimenticola sp.]